MRSGTIGASFLKGNHIDAPLDILYTGEKTIMKCPSETPMRHPNIFKIQHLPLSLLVVAI